MNHIQIAAASDHGTKRSATRAGASTSTDAFRRRFYLVFLTTLTLTATAVWGYLALAQNGAAMRGLPLLWVASLSGLVVLWKLPGSIALIERTMYWLGFLALLAMLYFNLDGAATLDDRHVAFRAFSVWMPALAVWSFLIFGSRRGLFATLGFVGVAAATVTVLQLLGGTPLEASSQRLLAQLVVSGTVFLLMLFTLARVLERQNEARAIAEAEAEQAVFDPLTGLLNRRGMHVRFERAREFVDDSGDSLAMLFIDVDDFKGINDEFGHSGGDLMLQQFARRLTQAVRGVDLVARVGGDEFVVLAIVKDPADAHLLAAKLIAAYEAPFVLDAREVALHASLGVSVYPQDGVENDVLMSRADAAMYQAKAGGKNGWVAARDPNPAMSAATLS